MSLEQVRDGRRHIGQGEFAIDGGERAVISTLLGSCVSACIWDPQREIGGMNHVLFVDPTRGAETAFGYGVNSMELLLNGLFRLGARKSNLRAKIFGGAQMIGRTSDAGQKNVNFVTEFLIAEGLTLEGGDTGGTNARRLEFWPGLGRARVKLVADVRDDVLSSPGSTSTSDPELF